MIVGTLIVDMLIPGADSLKDKRRVIKSILDITRRVYNVSAAEIGAQDIYRRAELGFACISTDKALVNRLLDKILDQIESNPLCDVVESDIRFI